MTHKNNDNSRQRNGFVSLRS